MSALFGYTGPRDSRLLQRMAGMLAHRGSRRPVFDESQCGSIGFDPALPLTDEEQRGAGLYTDGEFSVACAGFLTNAPDLRPVLQSILDRYRREGLAFLQELRGAFVMAIRDGQTVHLIRDGAGARTVYYARHEKRFFFAVEPKGIFAVPGFPRRILPKAVARFLTFSFQPGHETLVEGLYEVPAGCVVSCDGTSEPVIHRYFCFEETAPGNGKSDAEWIHDFRTTFAASVRDRIPGDEPVGVFLSGGIDSSVVAAELARQRGERVPSFSVHFGKRYPHELEFARMVAERCKTDHHEVLVQPRQFLPRLRSIVWHLDDAIGDPVAMPNFELARYASKHVRYVFNGEGGDPVFGGPKNLPMLMHHWYGVPREEAFRERRYLASYNRAYEEIARLLTPAWRERIDPEADLEQILTPFFQVSQPRSFLDKMTAINIRLKGAHLILPKVERMTAAWRITPLSPLFDERIVRLSFQMPGTMKLRHGIEKVVMKEAYRDELPAPIIARPKSGMRVPVHYWFQGEMKRYARRILSPSRVREVGIFDPDRVAQLLRYDTEEGPGRYGLRLWMLVTFEIWRRIVIEGEAP